ncbi:origin recognition complex subunit 2 [Anopheles bellator]|uniref:origin recognition complex subunit 2 n=1 Tax=Anopheles bellator TaxID=139047 RepID=UPI002649D515|nr:origin recognition complex subunit 2 [Anopheles bellator]
MSRRKSKIALRKDITDESVAYEDEDSHKGAEELGSEAERVSPIGKTDTARRSQRPRSVSKRYSQDFVSGSRSPRQTRKSVVPVYSVSDSDESEESSSRGSDADLELRSDEKDALDELGRKVSATTLFEEQTDVAGQHIFGFRTPRKRQSMSTVAALASLQRTPQTPSALAARMPRTPRTPATGGRAHAWSSASVTKTPAHVRTRAKRAIKKVLQAHEDSDFSPDESDYSPGGSESESDESPSAASDAESDGAESDAKPVEQKATKPRVGRPPKTVQPTVPVPVPIPAVAAGGSTPAAVRRGRPRAVKKPDLKYVPCSDEYFSTHAGSSKSVTSDHTLDRLNTPRLTQDVLFRLLEETKGSTTARHQSSIQELLDEYGQNFSRWLFLLNEGFNVLLYGLGSKRTLLQTFHRQALADRPVLVVNGFFPALTAKDVMDAVAGDLLDLQLQTSNHNETLDSIERELSYLPNTHLFLLVHNIDGVAMRNERIQAVLCRLASMANVHLVATVDHINAPLMWDMSKLSHYNFCWWDATTLLPYSVETAFENSLLVQNSGAPALASMRSVVESLTSNARGIFMMIVNHQLANGGQGNQQYAGMLLKELYWACREAFLVSSDAALRAQLTEFTDHKLLRIKRTVDGAESLQIPLDHGLLQRFVDEQKSDA